jgi:hypothetical protein
MRDAAQLYLHFSIPRFLASSLRTADMFHDLNVPWTDATRELQRTVAFLDECEQLCVFLSFAPCFCSQSTDAVQ